MSDSFENLKVELENNLKAGNCGVLWHTEQETISMFPPEYSRESLVATMEELASEYLPGHYEIYCPSNTHPTGQKTNEASIKR